jgi:vacuolar iron transporter family protein
VIGGDSDTSASIKRREFVPFALAACLAAAFQTTKVIVTVGLAIVASAIAVGLGGYLAARTDAVHCAAQKEREYWKIDNLRDKALLRNSDD